MKKLLLYFLAFVAIAAGVLFVEKITAPEADMAINFVQSGHIVKDNPGMKPGVWFLVYEKPGMPALSIELAFDEKSVCSLGGSPGTCPDILLASSALIKIQGVKGKDVVRVVRAGN